MLTTVRPSGAGTAMVLVRKAGEGAGDGERYRARRPGPARRTVNLLGLLALPPFVPAFATGEAMVVTGLVLLEALCFWLYRRGWLARVSVSLAGAVLVPTSLYVIADSLINRYWLDLTVTAVVDAVTGVLALVWWRWRQALLSVPLAIAPLVLVAAFGAAVGLTVAMQQLGQRDVQWVDESAPYVEELVPPDYGRAAAPQETAPDTDWPAPSSAKRGAAAGSDTTAAAAGPWRAGAKLPTPRTLLALAAAPDGTLYAVGGRQEAHDGIATVESYDPVADAWRSRAPLPTPRDGAAAAVGPDGLLYVVGGHSRGNDIVGTVEVFDPVTERWEERAPMPTPRQGLGLVAARDGKLYAIGGSGPRCASCTNVEAYDPRTGAWSARTGPQFGRTAAGTTLGADGRIYVIGGTGHADRTGTWATMDSYDPATDTWRAEAPLPVRSWALQAVTGTDGTIYVVGGFEVRSGAVVVGRVGAYDPQRKTWTLRSALATSRTHAGAAVGLGGKIYVAGGSGPGPIVPPGTLLDSVEVYDPSADPLAVAGSGGDGMGERRRQLGPADVI